MGSRHYAVHYSVRALWVVSRSLFRRASNLGGDGFVFRPSLPRCPRQAVAAARAKARTPAYGSRGLWRRRREPPWLSEAQRRVRPVSASIRRNAASSRRPSLLTEQSLLAAEMHRVGAETLHTSVDGICFHKMFVRSFFRENKILDKKIKSQKFCRTSKKACRQTFLEGRQAFLEGRQAFLERRRTFLCSLDVVGSFFSRDEILDKHLLP